MWLARRVGSDLRGTPVERAIAATQDRLGNAVVVSEALTAWCQSPEFREVLEEFSAGKRAFTGDEVVESFIRLGGFYQPDEEHEEELAREVVERFLAELEAQLLRSSEAIPTVAARQEVIALEQRRAIAESATEVIDQVGRRIDALGLAVAGGPAVSGRDSGLASAIDAARDLLLAGQATAARALLRALEDRIGSAEVELAFRYETNLGAVALDLGDLGAARDHFSAALRLAPNSSKALANMAQLELRAGRHHEALDLARSAWSIEPRESHAGVALLLALEANGLEDELNGLLEEHVWLRTDSSCVGAIGQIAFDHEKFEEAIAKFRLALAADRDNARLAVRLALALIRHVQSDLYDQPPLSWRMALTHREELSEADALLSDAVETLSEREPRAAYLEALSLRAGLRSMLGRGREAEADADRVLAEDPDHATALRTKGIALLRRDPQAAIEKLAVARGAIGADIGLNQALAHAYEMAGSIDDAVSVMQQLREMVRGSRDEIATLATLMRLEWLRGRQDQARTLESELESTWDGDPEATMAKAHFAEAAGEREQAIQYMRTALANASGNLRERIAVELADILIAHQAFTEAAQLLSGVVDDAAPLELRQRYVGTLYKAGRLKDALTFAVRQRAAGSPVPGITDVEAQIRLRISDWRGARDLFVGIAEQDPRRVDALLNAAGASYTDGDQEAARTLLRRVDEEELGSDSRGLMQLAHLRLALREERVLQPAYRARRLGFDDPDMHLGYLSVFLGRSERETALLETSEVQVDAAVELVRPDQRHTFIIEDDDPIAAQDEVSSDSPVARLLAGHRTGDTVRLKTGGIEELAYEIGSVKSKYVHAFQDTVQNFSTRFPEHAGLHRIEVRDHDISQFLHALDVQGEHGVRVLALYAEQPLPVSTVAKMLGRPYPDVWRGLWSTPDQVIHVSTGEDGDAAREAEAASAPTLVLELAALMTLDELGVWEDVRPMYDRIVAPQAMLDLLREERRELEGTRPKGYAAKVGGRYVMEDLSDEQYEEDRRRLERLVSRLKADTEIVPATAVLDIEPGQLEVLTEMLQPSALTAIHIARQDGLTLLSDDLRLRQLARHEWGVAGTWTQPILARARSEGRITDETYRHSLRRMAEWRFRHVPLTSDDLVALLRSSGVNREANSARAVGVALGTDVPQLYAVQLAAEVIRGLWLSSILSARKHLLLGLVLASLVRGRPLMPTIALLIDRLRNRVRLLLDGDEIIGSVAQWARLRQRSPGLDQ